LRETGDAHFQRQIKNRHFRIWIDNHNRQTKRHFKTRRMREINKRKFADKINKYFCAWLNKTYSKGHATIFRRIILSMVGWLVGWWPPNKIRGRSSRTTTHDLNAFFLYYVGYWNEKSPPNSNIPTLCALAHLHRQAWYKEIRII
jgi:hypothetical protein